jgi:hypothetical protein
MMKLCERLGNYWLILCYGFDGAQRRVALEAASIAIRIARQQIAERLAHEKKIGDQFERLEDPAKHFGRG